MKNKRLIVIPTKQFKKDYKQVRKQGKKLFLLEKVINVLSEGERLPAKNRDHTLQGDYGNSRECHINPDWLLIYKVAEENLFLVRMGSHSNLFG